MKKIGLIIALLGSIICVTYLPYEYKNGLKEYTLIFAEPEHYKERKEVYLDFFANEEWAMKALSLDLDHTLNTEQLIMQLVLVNLVGFGLAIVGAVSEKKKYQKTM